MQLTTKQLPLIGKMAPSDKKISPFLVFIKRKKLPYEKVKVMRLPL